MRGDPTIWIVFGLLLLAVGGLGVAVILGLPVMRPFSDVMVVAVFAFLVFCMWMTRR